MIRSRPLCGITFLLTLVPVGIAAAWYHRRNNRQAIPALTVALVIFAVICGYGSVCLAQHHSQPPICVGLAVTDTTIQYFDTEQAEKAIPVVQACARRIAEAAQQGAKVLCFPKNLMDFSALGREYSQAGVGLMLVPAWDFVQDAWLHARMAVWRGVEGGYAVVRCAQEGMLTVSDHCGRILAEKSSPSSGEVILVHDVSPGPGHTFYSVAGNWFGWTNVVFGLSAITMLVVKRRRESA